MGFWQILLSRLARLRVQPASGGGNSESKPASEKAAFTPPDINQLSTLEEYVSAARAVVFLLQQLREGCYNNPGLKVPGVSPGLDHAEAVLTRFERAERCLSGVGFLPVMPRAFVRLPSHVHDVTAMVTSGTLRRRQPGMLPMFYAGGLRRHAETLRKQGLTSRSTSASPRSLK